MKSSNTAKKVTNKTDSTAASLPRPVAFGPVRIAPRIPPALSDDVFVSYSRWAFCRIGRTNFMAFQVSPFFLKQASGPADHFEKIVFYSI